MVSVPVACYVLNMYRRLESFKVSVFAYHLSMEIFFAHTAPSMYLIGTKV